MTRTFELQVVTPERRVFSEQVSFVSLRGAQGELGILPGHIPLCTTLAPGLLQYTLEDGRQGVLTVMGGFLNVQPDGATVLADVAERAEELDEHRARKAKERAEQHLSEQQDALAEASLQRALVRLRAFEVLGTAAARR
ncbi:MAG: F0F1 ATP synthase subunit epsilon [Candidatus Sericytochromatia bacterium]|nr:F0F1 ATP synthase subunit epsilon [Candidatus Sericytochromatia bacterium]